MNVFKRFLVPKNIGIDVNYPIVQVLHDFGQPRQHIWASKMGVVKWACSEFQIFGLLGQIDSIDPREATNQPANFYSNLQVDVHK